MISVAHSVWVYVFSPVRRDVCLLRRLWGRPPSDTIHIADLLSTDQAIGGAVWHGVKGFRNSPYGERRIGALTAIKARAPVLGGNFGVWGGLFSSFDCAVKGIRKKEDPYNASM